MKRILSAAVALFSIHAFALGGGVASGVESQPIKVRIKKMSTSFQVTGVGLRFSGSPEGAFQALSHLPVKKIAHISYHNGAWTISNNEKSLTVLGSKLEISSEALTIGKTKVPARGLFVVSRQKAKVSVDYVARLELEEYLVDVVAAELPFGWPLEAKKAQAVAARSYAMSVIKGRRNQNYDVDSSTQDQVYEFGRSTTRGQAQLMELQEAVQSTRSVTLVDSKGRLLKSYFHAHCGGETEEPKEVWPVEGRSKASPKFGITTDNGCAVAKPWRTQIPFSEITHRLARTRNGPTPVTIQQIHTKLKMGSQRVEQIFISALEGLVKMRAQDFRQMFGYDRVKSTLFTARAENNMLYLEGRGHGHGVGMCQTGAKLMAMGGAHYEQILRKYYPHAQLSKPPVQMPVGVDVASNAEQSFTQ